MSNRLLEMCISCSMVVLVRDELTETSFNQMIATGLKQAKEDDSFAVDEILKKILYTRKYIYDRSLCE